MKNLVYAIILFIAIIFTNTQSTYAIFCSNCSTNVQQGFQLVKESFTAVTSNIGAVQQTLSTVNDTVLIPAKDALTVISVIESGKMINGLILGEFGVDPLLVRKPEEFIAGRGREVVQGVLENPELQSGLYEASALNYLVDQTRYDSLDLADKIKAINTSNLPAIEQSSRCTDQALTALAIKDVEDADGTYSQTALTARKKELYDALCRNDANDPKTQEALLKISEQTPSLLGLLAVTSGDNKWKTQQDTLQAIAEEKRKQEEAARQDLINGGGIKSEEECLRYARPGDKTSACLERQIINPGDILNDSFKNSLSAPLDLQLAGFGKGAGSLISTAFSTMNLLKGIRAGLGGSSSGGSGGGAFIGNNTPTTIGKTPVNDLANNPQAKQELLRTPKDQLIAQKQSLQDLGNTDIKYLTALNSYRGDLVAMESCYDSLISDFPEVANDDRITSAQSFYTSEVNRISSQRSEITTEQGLISNGISLLNGTIAKMEASQSSEEILNLFLDLQNKTQGQSVLGIGAAAERENKYSTFTMEVQQSGTEGGQLSNFNATCSSMRQERGGGYTNPGGGGGGI